MTAPLHREAYTPPRYRPAPIRPGMIVQNTGAARLEHGDWSVVMPDGSRKPWRRA